MSAGIGSDRELSVVREGRAGIIVLKRPEALNALSLEMIRLIDTALARWAEDPGVGAVFITGAGERAFCAGGDIKTAYYAGLEVRKGRLDERIPAVFFGEEYRLNARMAAYPKPLVALINGIVMGGGYGIAGNCAYRVACPEAQFAMPEVGIGFFPDVGSAWHMARMPRHSGLCLGMTGVVIGPEDMLFTRAATHCAVKKDFGAIVEGFARSGSGDPHAAVERVLNAHSRAPGRKGELESAIDAVDRAFSARRAEDIEAALKGATDRFLRKCAGLLASRSPLGVKVALEHIRMAASDPAVKDVLERDFILARRFFQDGDFYEGVRAALIDRDRAPAWKHASLADVDEETVRGFFARKADGLYEI